jgi:TatD DNase family protein
LYEEQERWLSWHWDLAERLQKPLILHLVRSSSDILALLKRRAPQTPWLWHDFQGPLEAVEKVLSLHPRCYFSFGPRSIKKRQYSDLWAAVPAHLRLIETDDSGLSIEQVLDLTSASEDQVRQNFHTLFSLL